MNSADTATLTTSSDGKTITGVITDPAGAVLDTFTVKDGGNIVARLDRKVCRDLLWNRSGYSVVDGKLTATLTRSATYMLLAKVNAR